MKRRDFVWSISGAVAAGAALNACGGGGDGDSPDAGMLNCTANGAGATIGANHGHSAAAISATDVNAGAEKTYNLSGGGHTHMITVTAAQFTTLQGGSSVMVTSTNDSAHTHTVTLTCA